MAATEPDYLIVGGGLTGCALASRLKQANPALNIMLIEAGTDPAGDPRVVSPMEGFGLAYSDLDWAYQTAPQRHTRDRVMYSPAGKTLGGGSMLNYGGWARGDAKDYDEWARLVADPRWSYKGLLPYFKKSESDCDPKADPHHHGFQGPVRCTRVSQSDPERRYPLREPVRTAWTELGLHYNRDSNRGSLAGISEVCENWHQGVRQPSNLAYGLSGVNILTNTTVDHVLFKKSPRGQNRASGVVLVDGRQILARKEVILAAGTYRTAQLLMLSGIGPLEDLNRYKIPIIKELPAVGRNLFDHYSLFQYWKLRDPSKGLSMGSPLWKSPALYKGMPVDWITYEHVPDHKLLPALAADNASNELRAALLHPSRCHIETMILYTAGGAQSVGLDLPVDGTYIASYAMLSVPTSRGRVSLASRSIKDRPVVDPNYYATAVDRAALIHGVRRVTRAMLGTKAGNSFIADEVPPKGLPALTLNSTDAEIDARIRAAGISHAHASGTAAMGQVVSSSLKVIGVDGLRVADNSVLPTSIGGHPQATLYAVAEQAADMILQDGGGGGGGDVNAPAAVGRTGPTLLQNRPPNNHSSGPLDTAAFPSKNKNMGGLPLQDRPGAINISVVAGSPRSTDSPKSTGSRAGSRERNGSRERAGSRDRVNLMVRAGSRDSIGGMVRVGSRDRVGGGGMVRVGSKERTGLNDRAGSKERTGSKDRAGSKERTGSMERQGSLISNSHSQSSLRRESSVDSQGENGENGGG